MENIFDTIKDFLMKNGYKIIDVDKDGTLSVRFQMNVIQIYHNKDNPEAVSMILSNIDEIEHDNPLPVMLACMKVVSQQMVVKAYPIGMENVIATYEFFFKGEDDLKYHIKKGLIALIAAKVQYHKYKKEMEND